jgi:hypothetical protein
MNYECRITNEWWLSHVVQNVKFQIFQAVELFLSLILRGCEIRLGAGIMNLMTGESWF